LAKRRELLSNLVINDYRPLIRGIDDLRLAFGVLVEFIPFLISTHMLGPDWPGRAKDGSLPGLPQRFQNRIGSLNEPLADGVASESLPVFDSTRRG
jgi:hypothetical protein